MASWAAKNQRIRACDGLRAIALLGVISFHVWPDRVPGGYLGVNIFFVLAGFFVSRKIYYSLVRDGRFSLRGFYQKRFLRLYLPLVPLLIATNLWTYFFQPSVHSNVQQSTPSVLLFCSNIYQLLGHSSYFATHGNFQPLTHLWALALEAQFYLLFPLLFLLLSRVLRQRWRQIAAVLFGVSVLSAVLMAVRYQPGVDPTPIYYSLLCRLFAFTLGAGAALAYLPTQAAKNVLTRSKSARGLMASACLLIIVISFFFMDYQNHYVYLGGMFLYSLVTACCIILVHTQDLSVSRLLSSPYLLFLSQRSYSFYLWQYTLQVLGNSWFAFSTTPIAARHLLGFILLLVIGEVSYRLFEQRKVIFLPDHNCRRLLVAASLLLLVVMQVNLRPTIADIPPQPVPQPVEQNETDIHGKDVEKELQQLRLIAVGDSVLDMAKEQLKLHLPKCTVDAKISRQIGQGLKTLSALKDEGTSGDVILISLGTNGDFREHVLDQYYQLAGEKPLIFITTVMPDSWEQSVNDKLRHYAATHPGVYIADWYALAKNHAEWFYSDGTHPKPEGVQQLVALILQQLEEILVTSEVVPSHRSCRGY